MSRAEKLAQENKVYKQRFLNAFQGLHGEGHALVSLDQVMPRAAEQDDVFMTRRKLINDIKGLFGRRPEDAPYGLVYPPRKGAGQRVIEQLVEEGLVEAVPNPLARYDDAYGDSTPGTIYRLAQTSSPQFEAELQPDVAITT